MSNHYRPKRVTPDSMPNGVEVRRQHDQPDAHDAGRREP